MRGHVDRLAKEAEEAAQRGEQGTSYAITRQITNSKFKKSMPVRSKEGVRITTEAGQLERWKQHFEEVLNVPAPQSAVDEIMVMEQLDIDVKAPSMEEIIRSLKRVRNGKAPGIHNIQAEVLKVDIETMASALHHVFTKIWNEEVIPVDWQRGVIVKLPKKGNLEVCENWRGVTLLSVPGKVLCRMRVVWGGGGGGVPGTVHRPKKTDHGSRITDHGFILYRQL